MVAGVTPAPDARFSVLGMSFQFRRPDLLPVGLAVAVLYGLARYHYYAIMLASSPYRTRRDELDRLIAVHEDVGPFPPGKEIPMYFGATTFEVPFYGNDSEKMKQWAAQVQKVFPKFGRRRVQTEIISHAIIENDGEEHLSYSARIVIPIRCRLAAFFEDADYTIPVWANAIVLALYAWRLITRT